MHAQEHLAPCSEMRQLDKRRASFWILQYYKVKTNASC